MANKTKLDSAIVCLLAISTAALIAFHLSPKTLTISTENQDWLGEALGNATPNGQCVKADAFELRLDAEMTESAPYSMLWLRPKAGSIEADSIDVGTQDLSWVQSIAITAKVDGSERESFRLQFRGYNPKLYSPIDNTSMKYNEVTFYATDQWKTVEFDRGNLSVPGWWAERHATDPADTSTDLQQIKWIEVASGTNFPASKVKLSVRDIVLSGYWIDPILFYRSLLGCWTIMGITVLCGKFNRQRVDLNQVTQEKKNLSTINDSLRLQADEYSSLAKIDSLTGLPNRRGIDERIKEMLGDDSDSSYNSLIIFDIDNFKCLNDDQGHLAGDAVLEKVGKICTELSNDNFVVSRWGGEEFLAFYSGNFSDKAFRNAELLRQSIKRSAGVTCSFGIHHLSPGEEFSQAVTKADCSLYQAKRVGKNCIEVYEADLSISQQPVSV